MTPSFICSCGRHESTSMVLRVAAYLLLSSSLLLLPRVEAFGDFTNITQIFQDHPPAALPNPFQDQFHGVWDGFKSLLDARKGQPNCKELPMLKSYLVQFGYYPSSDSSTEFDDSVEAAIVAYQKNFGLEQTGVLDEATLSQMMRPRCGREDMVDGVSVMASPPPKTSSSKFLHGTKHYSFFPNSPKWDQRPMLTYSIDAAAPGLTGIAKADLEATFDAAFGRWAAVVPINFSRVDAGTTADITILFAAGDHGDGKPFDGVLGVLAHAFSPEDGRLHFDAAEAWSLDAEASQSKNAVDLLSVAVHEIGHILGLGHSSDEGAVMFPNIGAREVKVALNTDDVRGAQSLYGANPSYDPSLVTNVTRSQPENGIPDSAAGPALAAGFLSLAASAVLAALLFVDARPDLIGLV